MYKGRENIQYISNTESITSYIVLGFIYQGGDYNARVLYILPLSLVCQVTQARHVPSQHGSEEVILTQPGAHDLLGWESQQQWT